MPREEYNFPSQLVQTGPKYLEAVWEIGFEGFRLALKYDSGAGCGPKRAVAVQGGKRTVGFERDKVRRGYVIDMTNRRSVKLRDAVLRFRTH